MINAAVVGLGWWGKTLVESAANSDTIRFVAGATRTVTPEVEMQMGHGLPITGRVRAAGGNVVLGTDVVSSVSADMFSQMRFALQCERALANVDFHGRGEMLRSPVPRHPEVRADGAPRRRRPEHPGRRPVRQRRAFAQVGRHELPQRHRPVLRRPDQMQSRFEELRPEVPTT